MDPAGPTATGRPASDRQRVGRGERGRGGRPGRDGVQPRGGRPPLTGPVTTPVMPSQPIPGYSQLPAKGNLIGSGAEGTVFDLPGHPDWVLKEFKPGTVATQASNEANHLDDLRRVFGD